MGEPSWPDTPFDDEFDEDLRNRIKAEVDPDEPVLWAGRPLQRPKPVGARLIIAAVFDVALFAVFAVCVAYAVRNRPADPLVPFTPRRALLPGRRLHRDVGADR